MMSSQSPFQNNHLLLEKAREMGSLLNAFWYHRLSQCKECDFLRPRLPQFLLLSLRNLGIEPLNRRR